MTQLQTKLNEMKLEIAAQFGIADYDGIDKGELPSRLNGKIGGEMTKRLIELGKMQLLEATQRELVPVQVTRERVQQKQLLLPWPEAYDEERLPTFSAYSSLNRRFYH